MTVLETAPKINVKVKAATDIPECASIIIEAIVKVINPTQKYFGSTNTNKTDIRIGIKAKYHFSCFLFPLIPDKESVFLISFRGSVIAPRIKIMPLIMREAIKRAAMIYKGNKKLSNNVAGASME